MEVTMHFFWFVLHSVKAGFQINIKEVLSNDDTIISVKERLEKGNATQPEPVVSGLLFRKSMAVIGDLMIASKTNFALQL